MAKIDNVARRMLEEYDVPGIIKKDTSEYESLQAFLGKSVSKKDFLQLFQSIFFIRNSMYAFLLDENQIPLELDKIYIHKETKECMLTYNTDLNFANTVTEEDFVRRVVFSARFNPNEDGSYIMKLINYLNGVDGFSVDGFLELVKELNTDTTPVKEEEEYIVPETYLEDDTPEPEESYWGQYDSVNDNMMGETMVLSDYMLMMESKPFLIRVKNNERITIDKDVFVIGKERSKVDYCISDNKAVSRRHADIVCENNTYFIIDNNSLNKTYLNDMRLAGGEKYALSHKDVIVLGDEEFSFNFEG